MEGAAAAVDPCPPSGGLDLDTDVDVEPEVVCFGEEAFNGLSTVDNAHQDGIRGSEVSEIEESVNCGENCVDDSTINLTASPTPETIAWRALGQLGRMLSSQGSFVDMLRGLMSPQPSEDRVRDLFPMPLAARLGLNGMLLGSARLSR